MIKAEIKAQSAYNSPSHMGLIAVRLSPRDWLCADQQHSPIIFGMPHYKSTSNNLILSYYSPKGTHWHCEHTTDLYPIPFKNGWFSRVARGLGYADTVDVHYVIFQILNTYQLVF